MSRRASSGPLSLMILLTLLSGGCDRTAPTGVASGPAAPQARADEGQGSREPQDTQSWPCPQAYVPVAIHEFVASTPPLKAPGDPDYWDQCPATPGHFTNHASSTGTATYLGSFANEWDSCLDVIHGIGFFDARLTAANGDELNWDITARATPLPGGGLHFETTSVTFDGGTGRFADATGYASGSGDAIPGQGETYDYAGCLAY